MPESDDSAPGGARPGHLRVMTLNLLSPDHGHFGVVADLAVPGHPPGRWAG
jgi:hypothetical protein